MSSANQIIEHIVLLKVKPDADPSAVSAMIAKMNGLISLDLAIHLAPGPVTRCRSNSLSFTHMLHCRYRSKTDLVSYLEHPTHKSVVSDYVTPVIDDIIVVDWVVDDLSGPVVVSPGSVARLTVLKVKEGAGESVKSEVLKVLRGIKEKFPSIEQLTVGENFWPGKNKGYSICSIAISKEFDSELEEAKVRELADDVLVVDYKVAGGMSLN